MSPSNVPIQAGKNRENVERVESKTDHSKKDNGKDKQTKYSKKDAIYDEEEKFEKTAAELEEVLKRKFPDTSSKTSAQKPQAAGTPSTTQSPLPISTLKTGAGMKGARRGGSNMI